MQNPVFEASHLSLLLPTWVLYSTAPLLNRSVVPCLACCTPALLSQALAGGAGGQQPGQQQRLQPRRCRTLAAVCCCLRVTGWFL